MNEWIADDCEMESDVGARPLMAERAGAAGLR